MRCIAKVCDSIKEETEGACHYARMAMDLRDCGYPNAANTVIEMARQETKHADMLHEIAVAIISQERSSGREIPQGMLDVWQWQHGELVEKMAHAKEEIALFSK